MTAYKLCLVVMVFLGLFVSYRRNNDLFSPIKIYIYYSVFFYLSLFYSEVSFLTLIVYTFLLLSIFILIPFERPFLEANGPGLRQARQSIWSYIVLWALTFPGLIVKVWFVHEAGGLSSYLDSLAFRVLNWKGQGHYIILLGMIPALSLMYFTLIIRDSDAGRLRWGGFILHFIVFIAIGLLMGSRSFIAIPLLGYLLAYSYFKRKVSFGVITVFFIFIVILAGVLGAIRNSYGTTIDDISMLFRMGSFELAHFSYGVNPLEIVFSSSSHPLLMGESYLSLFTNFFPRSIFENKLQTGGLTFTQYYTSNQWEGMSHLAPGAVGEAVMNFGIAPGIFVGFLLNLIVMLTGVIFYNSFTLHAFVPKQFSLLSRVKSIALFMMYFYYILLAARFSFAEFTSVFYSYAIYSMLPAFMFIMLNICCSKKAYCVLPVSGRTCI